MKVYPRLLMTAIVCVPLLGQLACGAQTISRSQSGVVDFLVRQACAKNKVVQKSALKQKVENSWSLYLMSMQAVWTNKADMPANIGQEREWITALVNSYKRGDGWCQARLKPAMKERETLANLVGEASLRKVEAIFQTSGRGGYGSGFKYTPIKLRPQKGDFQDSVQRG